nr:MBL fold metallo-hydrolase [Candidatus Sigynarchaeota archaeon]
TGSCHLAEVSGKKVLLDCGMHQGKDKQKREFSFNPKKIDYVVLSHGHIDHSGLLPLLVADGFTGTIYATPATRDVSQLLLYDSAKIQAEDEEKGLGIALYTESDVSDAMGLFEVHDYTQPFRIGNSIEATFFDAGHILGSALTRLEIAGFGSITYTGDIGHGRSPILNPAAKLPTTDFLIMESTYGDTNHPAKNYYSEFERVINHAYKNSSKVLIPVFAVGRAQEILYTLGELKKQGSLPEIPIYFDTPMGIHATELYHQHEYALRPEFREYFLKNKNIFKFDGVAFVKSHTESCKIADSTGQAVVLATSGMLEGGRCTNHLPTILPDPNAILAFVGYQADGTVGRNILDGTKEITITEKIPINCTIERISGLSAHADKDALVSFFDSFPLRPQKTFIVHGEMEKSERFCKHLIKSFRCHVEVPEANKKYSYHGSAILEKVHDFMIRMPVSFQKIGDKEIAPVVGCLVREHGVTTLLPKDVLLLALEEQAELMGRQIQSALVNTATATKTDQNKTTPADRITLDDWT